MYVYKEFIRFEIFYESQYENKNSSYSYMKSEEKDKVQN